MKEMNEENEKVLKKVNELFEKIINSEHSGDPIHFVIKNMQELLRLQKNMKGLQDKLKETIPEWVWK